MRFPIYIRREGEVVRNGLGLQLYRGSNVVMVRIHFRLRTRRLTLNWLWQRDPAARPRLTFYAAHLRREAAA